MNMTEIKSLKELTDRELLELMVSSQMYLLYRVDALERKLTKKDPTGSDMIITDGLDKAMSFLKQIDTLLEKKATEDQ